MDKELRILILEDDPADTELEEHELRKAGIAFISKLVETKETFQKAIKDFDPDIILSDYNLLSFDGLTALTIAKEKCPHVPFVLVTGVMGEEFAIEILKKGATDYVLKSNLKRLVPVVHRALQEAKDKAERKLAEKALRDSEERYSTMFNSSPNAVFVHKGGVIHYINEISSVRLRRMIAAIKC
jgi:DNA-binding NtrC family response regulator